MNKDDKQFKQFINKFPEVDLPVTVTEETNIVFSAQNMPINDEMIRKYIALYETEPIDEYTEYVPCFRLKKTGDIYALVYWKAGLLTYQYYLTTYNKNGVQLAKQKIAGLVTHGEEITQAVANIEEDWIVYVVQNSVDKNKEILENSTQAYSLELLADGQIIFSINEDIH